MSIFANILCKQFSHANLPKFNYYSIAKLSDSSYSSSNIYDCCTCLIYHIYFMPYKSNYNKNIMNKFKTFNTIVLMNKNISQLDRDFLLYKFSNAQRIYSCFRKLAINFKLKYSKKFEVDTDLCFQPFSNFKPHILITLLENNIVYNFRLSDLINIINKSLSHSPMFFAEPYQIKNPYTNIPFSIANLYNIYFKIQQTNYIMPILFQQYFNSNFILLDFKHNNECYIRDKAIDYFMIDSSIDEKYNYILRMFYKHYTCILFTIDDSFPKYKLVNVFNKYLKLFLKEEYSLNPHIKQINKVQLDYLLTTFSQLNPNFGKKLWIKKRHERRSVNCYVFNEHVIESSDIIQTDRPRPIDIDERNRLNTDIYNNLTNNTMSLDNYDEDTEDAENTENTE